MELATSNTNPTLVERIDVSRSHSQQVELKTHVRNMCDMCGRGVVVVPTSGVPPVCRVCDRRARSRVREL